MPRLTRITAAALAATILVPSAALGATQLDFMGAPTLRPVDDRGARVSFTVDDPIAGKHKGAVEFWNGDRSAIRPDGRHGDDYRYKAVVRDVKLDAGTRYRVRIEARGYAKKSLQLKLVDPR